MLGTRLKIGKHEPKTHWIRWVFFVSRASCAMIFYYFIPVDWRLAMLLAARA
jgi:hypothetical protein